MYEKEDADQLQLQESTERARLQPAIHGAGVVSSYMEPRGKTRHQRPEQKS